MDNIFAVQTTIQDENLGTELFLHVETKFASGNNEVLRSNYTPQGAVLLRTKEIQSINTIEAADHSRPPARDAEDGQWKVEKLVEKRRIGRTVQYQVKWLGYPDSENTWEKKKDIDPGTVAAFEASLCPAQGLT
jgi:hypothetical protein